MKLTLFALSALFFFSSPQILYAKNNTGKAPLVICQAQEVKDGATASFAPFTRFDLSKNQELDLFLPITVLDGSRFRLQAYGSANSEQELWLRIEDKKAVDAPVYARGIGAAALTRVADWQTYARITCDNEAELKERYLADFCNSNGTVRNPEGREFLDEITRDCARLREIEVIKEDPPSP